MFSPKLFASALLVSICAFAQSTPTYQTRLFAGTPNDGIPGPALSARTSGPTLMTGDASGNIYYYASTEHRIHKFDPASGKITYIAGNGDTSPNSGDGPALNFGFFSVNGMAARGDFLYFSQRFPCLVRRVQFSTGLLSTIAGSTGNCSSAGPDGPALEAILQNLGSVTIDPQGRVYVIEGNRIRRIEANGQIVNFSGSPTGGFDGDGGNANALPAQYSSPAFILSDNQGNIFVNDAGNNRIRRIDGQTNRLTTYAGTGTSGTAGDGGQASAAQLNALGFSHLALDPSGTKIYITSLGQVRVIDLTSGIISTFAGSGVSAPFQENSPALQANLGFIQGVWAAPGGVYLAESASRHGIIRIANGVASIAAGGNNYRGDTVPSQNLWLSPSGVLPEPDGSVLISDIAARRIFRVSKQGVATSIAGTGVFTGTTSGNGGPATAADVSVGQMARDTAGNIYFADANVRQGQAAGSTDRIIRRITPSGIISEFGPALPGGLFGFGGMTIDPTGRFLYISQTHRVVRWDSQSNTTVTYAGAGAPTSATGTSGFSGDTGQATSALLNSPRNLALDSAGNLYIADNANHRVRKVDTSGVITTVLGNGGNQGASVPANTAATQFAFPNATGVAVDAQDNFYATTPFVAVRVNKTTGIVSLVAGGSAMGNTALGGTGASARFSSSGNLGVAANGEVFVADANNRRIAAMTPDSVTTPTISAVLNLYEWGGGDTISPNGWVELYGFKLSAAPRTWQASDFNGNVSPTSLAGVQVLFNGVPGVVQDVRSTHINAIPKDGMPAGNVTVQVVNAAGQSNIVSMRAAARGPGMQAPSIFADTNGKRYVAAYFASDGAYVGPPSLVSGLTFRRAQSGDKLVLYGIGFGGVTLATPAGNIAVGLTALPNIQFKIGDKIAVIDYAGLAPGFVGLYQFNITLPSGMPLDGVLEVIVDGVPLIQELALGVQ